MDPVRERVTPEDPLRALIQEAGYRSAPSDLEARVLDRLIALPTPPQQQVPLIGMKGWIAIAAMIAVVVITGFQLSPTAVHATSTWSELTAWSGWRGVTELITSRWLMALVAGVASVVTVDRLFTGKPARIPAT